jgi:hypothetical protein
MSYTVFATHEMLLMRLQNTIKQGKKLSILTGSGLTVPDLTNGHRGVSSVSEIVNDIHEEFRKTGNEQLFLNSVPSDKPMPDQYQYAMQVMLSCFGQDDLNKIIGSAVCNALCNKTIINPEGDINFSALERNPENWYLKPGADALGKLYVDFNEIFQAPILTSNFDPLIEVSIRKHSGNPNSIILVNDGKFLNQKSDKTHGVVHFHGYWYGSDTLHTVDQLKRERSQLKGDLKTLLTNSILLVIGYGGWNDVFTNTLLNLIAEGNNNFDVLWTFYEKEEDVINKKYHHVLSQMSSSLGQRVNLYKGVDCNILFPALLKEKNKTFINTLEATHFKEDKERTEINNKNEAFTCDVPPNNFCWVGRTKELELLKDVNYKICFITGIGGEGKSGLASHFVKNFDANKFELWDWRDCKEEDHKFQTVIISQVERLSKGLYRASKLSNEKIEDLVHLFFEVLGNRKVIFIYDNVDRYIDLEKFEPIGGVGELIRRINAYKHQSIFVFTCRPHVDLPFNSFLEMPLKSLSEEETIDLFNQYEPNINKEKLKDIALQAHNLSGGHALWLNLIAAQCKRGLEIVQSFLESYRYNKALQKDTSSTSFLESTLDVVWKALNTRQQILLRGLAEMVTALTKDELAEIFRSEMTINQFNKCFKVLNSMNLLVIKSSSGKEDLIELHPLVKEYITYKYRPNERRKFIMLFVNFYNQLILLIKPKLDADSPLAYFEKYTQKAELQINNKDYKDALISIHEVSEVINSAGYTEEYIRVTTMLFEGIDWFKAVAQEYAYFHEEFQTFIISLTQNGLNDKVEEYLETYFNVIPGKSKDYLKYCNLKCYYHWFRGQFNKAIEWGEKGGDLTNKGIGGSSNIEYNLALALRDSLLSENISKALAIFLKGESLEEIIKGTVDSIHFSSSYFGNIGRCLWFQNKVDEALFFYYKSLALLLNEKQINTVINQGYAGLWIYEALMKKKQKVDAVYFLKFCLINWERTAPIKAINVKKDNKLVLEDKKLIEKFSTMSNWEVESYCKKYIERNQPILNASLNGAFIVDDI